MPQEDNGTVNKTKSKAMMAVFTAIGICCILQFFVVGLINVIRGYSIATRLPYKILIAGLVVFLVLLLKYRKKPSILSFYSLTVSFVMIFVSLVNISQGKYMKKAEKYYSASQYVQALQACKKEAQTWYHLLSYNYNERRAMDMIAKTYCQLGDFDSARNTYHLMIDRYSGEFYAGWAQKYLLKLEKGLKIVAYYPDRIEEKLKPDNINETQVYSVPKHTRAMALYDIAQTYEFDLNCNKKALEVYTKILDMDVSKESKKLAKERIVQLTANADKN